MSSRSAADAHPENGFLKPLQSRLKQALAAAPLTEGQPLTITLATPQFRFDYFPRLQGDWFFWGRPARQHALLGSGEALRITATGKGRLQWLAQRLHQLRCQWLHLDPDRTGHTACAFTAFAFSAEDPMQAPWRAFPNTFLILPELLLRQENGLCSLSFSVSAEVAQKRELVLARWMARLQRLQEMLSAPATALHPEGRIDRVCSIPTESEWLQLVDRALHQIHRGALLDKVVPARCIQLRAPHLIDPARLMTRVARLHPRSTLVSARIDGHLFVAATPERLAVVCGDRITCDAIGGTSHRQADQQLDRRLAEALLSSTKTRFEHALVVDGIRNSLSTLCNPLDPVSEPELMSLRNLQHLWTPVRGTLKSGIGVLEAASRLHPTAAVNGHPAAAATAWLSRHEPMARGWYSGAAGWLDAAGGGDLSVLLRCALVQGHDALLYAGAGITGDSAPAAELQETELKFQTMLEALQGA